jgi:hypothetical protein
MTDCGQDELTKSSLVGLFVQQNKAGQYLGHYFSDHFDHLRGEGDPGIQLESRNEAFDEIEEAHNDVITFAL